MLSSSFFIVASSFLSLTSNVQASDDKVLATTATNIAVLGKPAAVTATVGDCTATCWDYVPSQPLDHCDVSCSDGFVTRVPLLTAVTTTTSSNTDRVTIVENGCTAVAWNIKPGAGADVQCPGRSLYTKAHPTTFIDGACEWTCQGLFPGLECAAYCASTKFQGWTKELKSTMHLIPNMIQSEGPSHGHDALEQRKVHKQGKEQSSLRPDFWSFNPKAHFDHNMAFEVPTAILSDTNPAPPDVTKALQSAYSGLSAIESNLVTPRPVATATTVAATSTISSLSVKTATVTSTSRLATTTVSGTTRTSTTSTSTATVTRTDINAGSDDHETFYVWLMAGFLILHVLPVILCLIL